MTTQHDRTLRVLPPHKYALPIHQRITDRRLQTAFQRLVAHLPTLPDGHRFVWTNRRRKSNPLAVPGSDMITACHIALDAAVAGGVLRTIEATALEVEAFIEEVRAAALAPYYRYANGERAETQAPSLATVGLTSIKESGEATTALAVAMTTRDPNDIDHAIREAREAIGPMQQFCDLARRLLTAPTMRAAR